MVLDPFRVAFGLMRRDAESLKELAYQPVTGPDARGEPLARLGQSHASIGRSHHKAIPLQPSDRLGHAGLAHPKARRQLAGPCPPIVLDQRLDQFHVVFGEFRAMVVASPLKSIQVWAEYAPLCPSMGRFML